MTSTEIEVQDLKASDIGRKILVEFPDDGETNL